MLATYATTRTLAPTQRIFGCFTNLMGMRLRLEGDPSVREWLSEVRRAVTDASAQSQIPAEELCEDLRPPGRRRRTSRRS